MKPTDYNTPTWVQWCPGCGNFGILMALKNAMARHDLKPHETVIVSGIGCHGKIPHYLNAYGFETLHGRPLPVATGVKLANRDMKVLAFSGDGDGYGIGTCHFIHTMRRNIDLTYIVHNNEIYGLTTGQTSPTSEHGFISGSTPHGAIEYPINPIALALSDHATFVARGFAGEVKHLEELIYKGIAHRGIALIDILQPCVSFNKINTYEWFQERVYKLEDDGHDPSDLNAARTKAFEWGKRIPIGLFYQIKRPTYGDELPQLKDEELCKQDIRNIDAKKAMEEYF